MTDSSPRSGAPISLDERPLVPQVVLRGASDQPDPLATSSPGPPVDGVAVVFFEPQSGTPHLVFVSEGLAAMVGAGVEELLGRDPATLFHEAGRERFEEVRRGLGLHRQQAAEEELADHLRPLMTSKPLPRRRGERRATDGTGGHGGAGPGVGRAATLDLVGASRPAPVERRGTTIDLGALDLDALDGMPTLDIDVDLLERLAPLGRLAELAGTGEDPPRVYTASQHLARRDGRPLPVHAAYSVVPSMTPAAPYVVAEFRDLEQPTAERLLADQDAVVRSLSRGYELGRVCHQVAAQVEEELGDGSRCWVALQAGDDTMEPVLTGGLPFETVRGALAEMLELGHARSRRVVAVDALSETRSRPLRDASVVSLWYLPLMAEVTGAGETAPPTSASSTPSTPDGQVGASAGSKPDRPLRGAMVVATPRARPTRPQARSLEHLAAVLHTAVEQATVEAELAHQTLHDPLTGLPNRALLVDRLGQVVARLERDDVALSVLLVDIDRFRTVNDSRGAEVGDRVLREVAGRLLTAVRLGDTVGRLASDQYLVMCAARKGELDAKAVARRILRALAEPIAVDDGDELRITASIGVVVLDEPGVSPAAIISSAESALARATAAGRGRMAMYEADHRHHQVEQHVIEQALHRAIGTDELVIHYQPLVEIRTGYMVGAEALIRWDRPGHGLVGPGEFIPVAEESELIIPLGQWIIDQVCRDLGRWSKSHGRSAMVTINLSARQLGADTLVPNVVSALRRNRLHPRRVGFEITESMEIRDAEAAVVNLNRLKEIGCRIAIDDFGIGHATLEYIRRFSMADALKIDRSFVAGLGTSREDTAIVDASIALASSLGLQVIAEGVEALDQLDGLRERGARYAQGYALAPPMPFDRLVPLWRRQRLYDPPWSTDAGPPLPAGP